METGSKIQDIPAMCKMNLKLIKYEVTPFVKCSKEVINKLAKLTFKHGHLRWMISPSRQKRFKYVVLALGPKNGILGWAGIYRWGKMNVGVYVRRGYRHNGIGKCLKEIAIEKTLRKNKSVFWHFKHNGKYEPIERTRY